MKYEYRTVIVYDRFDVASINVMYKKGWEPMFSSAAKEYIVFTFRRKIADEQE